MVHTEQWRITMLGDGGVGKTALAVQASCPHPHTVAHPTPLLSYPTPQPKQRQVASPGSPFLTLLTGSLQTYDPTIEDAFRHSVVVDDEMTYLEIVDTAGQEEYATLRDQWIREGEGFILVYSIASRRSYDRIKTFQDSIVRVKRGARPVFMLVGNKDDKQNEREVSREEAAALSTYNGLLCTSKFSAHSFGQLGRQWGCPFLETSAKTAHNVERMFNDTVRTLRAARDGDSRPSNRRSQPKDEGGSSGKKGGKGGKPRGCKIL
ncbi:Ras GTPase ras2 [Ceratobasidium sp. 392]|nr:Ras GTPase ras2 [Ceratobasidium sp. 392]